MLLMAARLGMALKPRSHEQCFDIIPYGIYCVCLWVRFRPLLGRDDFGGDDPATKAPGQVFLGVYFWWSISNGGGRSGEHSEPGGRVWCVFSCVDQGSRTLDSRR